MIGIELHAQLASTRKLFSPATCAFGAPPNSVVNVVDAGWAGSLPRLNRECLVLAARSGLALGCELHRESRFERKHYFYADQPAGYQLTQQRRPLCSNGRVEVSLREGVTRVVRVARLQLEQDTGKLVRERGATLLDLNRAGCALIEIVSEPDLRSGEEAVAYVTKVARLLRFLGTCDADMSRGNLRVDVNVSVAADEAAAAAATGVRCEIKNLNSLARVRDAVDYEVGRQAAVLARGGSLARETRAWDVAKRETYVLRTKEAAADYRFMRDPDLPRLLVTDEDLARIRGAGIEAPAERIERYRTRYGLSAFDAEAMALEPAAARFFEGVLTAVRPGLGVTPQTACNWISHELTGLLHAAGVFSLDRSPVSAAQVASLLEGLAEGTVTGALAKRVLREMFVAGDGASCGAVVQRCGLGVVDGAGVVADVARAVVTAELATEWATADANRRSRMLKHFMGQGMKQTAGKVKPDELRRALEEHLAEQGKQRQ